MRILLRTLAPTLLLCLAPFATAQQQIPIDAHAPATPFPHFWEQMFGSGRANLMLRESLPRTTSAPSSQVTGFQYVRFHAILDDENGVYTEDEHGNPVYNFAYVDQIYDGLLKEGVRPVVEISFMPKKLAFNPDALHPFWYKQNVSPPKIPRALGRPHHRSSPKTSSIATASTRSRSGTSRSGTSPTSISGEASRATVPTSSSTSTPPARSRPSARASASAAPPPPPPTGSTSSSPTPTSTMSPSTSSPATATPTTPSKISSPPTKPCPSPPHPPTPPWTTASASPSPKSAPR